MIPEDLKRMLDDSDTFRDTPGQQDRWGVIRDWLVKHGVEAPERLPARPSPPVGDLGHG